MKTIHISIFFLILATTVFSQCCLRFEGKKCVLCPAGTHLFRGNCIIDVKDCLTYKDGFDCATCNSGFQLNSTGDCEKIVTPPPVSINMIQNIVLIDPKNLKGPAADLFAISDDYLRSSKSQLTDAIPTAGRVKTFPNKTNQITIQYSIKNIYYRAILQMETDPLIIKQVSISKVSNLIIKLATTTPNTAKSVIFNPIAIINISAINLNNLNHLDIISLVQMQLINQNQQIDSIKSGNITTIFDGTYNISLLYSSKNKVIDLLITATVLKDRTAKIVEVKKIPSNLVTTPPITPNINIVNSDTLSINYVDFDPKNSIDQNYLICKDLINIQTVDFKNLDPTSAKRYSQAQFIFYQLRFTKLDSSIWQISINYDSNNYIAKIDKITQITNPTKPTNPVSTFTIVNDAQIYKDMYFLIVLDYINKQSNNKYKDSKIVSVQKSVNGVLNIYRVNFQEAGFKWEVLANINVSSFVTTGFVESKGNQIRSDSVDSNLTQISSQSAINKVVISQPTQAQIQNPTNIPTATGTSKSIPTPEPNNIKTPSPTPTPTQISTPIPTSTTIPTTTLTLTPASASVPVPAPAPTSTPNPTLTPTPSPISTPTSTSTPTLTPTSTLTSIPTPNPTPNPAQTSKPIPTPVPNSSDQASSSSNFSPKSNPNETSPQSAEISINPTIMQLATGFTRLTKTDLSSNQFVQIDSLIKSSNTRQLRNSVVLAAFSKTTSFTRNYQIYYSRTGSPEIYQALISRDQLRRRTYIISFTKI